MIDLLAVIALAAILCSLADIQVGMYFTVAAGFLQDPVRKLVPDEPVYISAVVLLFAAATFVSAQFRGEVISLEAIPGWKVRMTKPLRLFVCIVILQALASFFYYGSLVISGIGLLAYLAPIPAFMLGNSYARSLPRVQSVLWLYVGIAAIVTSGVYLEWGGTEWDILRSVGEPLVVYSSETGSPIVLPSGFMRAPEIAAWHAASGFCIAVLLGITTRNIAVKSISVLLCPYFLGAVFLTGRRKFLVEIMTFLPLLSILLIHLRVAAGRLARTIAAIAIIGVGLSVTGLASIDTVSRLGEASFRQEEQDFSEDLSNRIINLTVGAIPYVIATNGFFGSGAGSGSQGVQHFGASGEEVVGLAAEGGLGKLLAELGVPGLLAFIWLAASFARYMWETLGLFRSKKDPLALLTIGLAAFLIANAVVFMSAHQIFGDLFVLLLLGVFLGFVLAGRRLAAMGLKQPLPSSAAHSSPMANGRTRSSG